MKGSVRFKKKDNEHFLQVIEAKGKGNEIKLADYQVVSPKNPPKRRTPTKRSFTTIQLGFRFDTAQHRYTTNFDSGILAVLSSVVELFSTGKQKHSDLSMIDNREELITNFPLVAFTEPTGAETGNLIAVKNLVSEKR